MKIPSLARSGILLVDKPAGITSADAVNRLKKKFQFSKIGHGGTLDPFATGLLVVLTGEATKIARFMLEGEKSYFAKASLEFNTNTGDLNGTKIENSPTNSNLSVEDWQSLANAFLGRTKQTPPAFSAIKVKGKALYEYARKGETVEIKDREIFISFFKILSANTKELTFEVRSSGGTYIRVLAEDLAKKANLRAHLLELRRLESSQFNVKNAQKLDDVLEMAPESLPLCGLEEGLKHLPQVECDERIAEKIRHGNLSAFDALRPLLETPGYFVLNQNKKPVAICNHNPMMIPFCNIERVFDPTALGT
jgi:tRNA pseudouridine55 synthase